MANTSEDNEGNRTVPFGDTIDALDRKIRWRELALSYNRFWSSPVELPLRNVIGVVLNTPTADNVRILCEHFGVDTVSAVYRQMCQKQELGRAQRDLVSRYLAMCRMMAGLD